MGLQCKTKSMVFGRENIEQNLQLGQTEVENVQEFAYLESLITSGGARIFRLPGHRQGTRI